MKHHEVSALRLGLTALQSEVDATNRRNGFTGPDIHFNAGEKISLMHAELSEGLEYIRKGNGPSDHIEALGIEEELADVVIRILDFCAHEGLDLPSAIIKKHEFNATRPYKHGGKRF